MHVVTVTVGGVLPAGCRVQTGAHGESVMPVLGRGGRGAIGWVLVVYLGYRWLVVAGLVLWIRGVGCQRRLLG